MAVVSKVVVQNVRSHVHYTVNLAPGVTVITGPNGSGKTTLLESIYIALQGSSFKGSDNEVLRAESPWWKIDLLLDEQNKRTVKFDPNKATSRKQFIIDGKTTARLTPKNKYPIVLFEPEDLRLLNGSPARRRQFIDRFISQLNPLYSISLRKYERALRQRNNLLKRFNTSSDELFAWDITLAEHGAYLIEQRTMFIEKINSQLNSAYHDIAESNDEVSVHYSHTLVGDSKQKLLAELQVHIDRDKQLGNTSVGPHRHDVIFQLNRSPAISNASRGEVRTIILALKFLEVDIIEQLSGLKPLILLDDVFSELDLARQKALSDKTRQHQIVMTSTYIVSDSKRYHHVELI
ncbi:MAG: DNA replication/repair protein RecF [Candidatus Microsaccharimonas sossegonensis]|uniref:DNA replication and repair protein RecF n=1 Tax=Candidatus Microsaccharimonas sossegonensis TaxID=2506948 RepID=A0A4Q0AH94_9BACT|nr:MAG: DNA replication/repair protein RecF [Candidatus Microsaccharimonas sossegonensis]